MIGSDLFYIQLIIYRALASAKSPIVFYKNMILKFHKVYLCSIIRFFIFYGGKVKLPAFFNTQKAQLPL